jgi:eukaryotic-like serine/threonine-protein kinase
VLAASSRLGPYEIVAPLGAGGMGEVYRARDTRLGRDVAVKVLPEPFANNPDRLARFEREARAVAALSHPNILAIHDYGSHEAITYAVMELLEGETLRDRLATGPLRWQEAVEIGAAIAHGLAAAHAKGIVHRDLKPENLFLTADGQVKILDFGLARIAPVSNMQSDTVPYVLAETAAGMVMGTVGYMSPEQVRGQPADDRSDIFSFGCVLYEMVTGRRAFQRNTAAESMAAILHEEPPDQTASDHQVPAELWRLIRQCLAKSPTQRLQSARDLALGLQTTASDPGLHRPQNLRRPPRLVVGVVGATLLMGMVSASVYVVTRSGSSSKDGKPAAAAKSIESVAVLPFKNEGGDPKTEYLSNGLADQIHDSLRHVRRANLKIRSLPSVSRYKGREIDVKTVARELDVQVLVTGTLRQLGDDLTIRVDLVDGVNDNSIWSHSYPGKLAEILNLQDKIAREVAAHLRLQLTGEEEQRLTKRFTSDPAAYLLYREAMYHFNKFNPEGLTAAVKSCEQAIQKDPTYALAHAAMARCLILRGNIFVGPKKTFPKALDHVNQALDSDPDLAEAHSALGAIYMFFDWKWAEAERELTRALDLDPNVILTRNILGFCLAAQGRLDEALTSIQRGQELDPLAAARWQELAMCYNAMGRYDEAIEAAKQAIKLDQHFVLAYGEWGTALSQTKHHDEAVRELKLAVEYGKGHPRMRGLLGCAYARAGKEAEARTEITTLHSEGRFGSALSLARIYATLGEKVQAFEWLHKAGDERDSIVFWLKTDPNLARLRSEPQFTDMVKDMGLPP